MTSKIKYDITVSGIPIFPNSNDLVIDDLNRHEKFDRKPRLDNYYKTTGHQED